jgi:hypothetical protein
MLTCSLFLNLVPIKTLFWTTTVQNKLEGIFKIGIRPQIGIRLQAEVSVERIAGSEQNRDLLPTRYTLFATRYNLILQPTYAHSKLYFGQA